MRPKTSGNGVVLHQNFRCLMPRPKKSVPSYLHHKPTNQAFIRLPDGNGGREYIYLGEYDSPESRAEYARIVQELSITPIFKSADQIAVGGSDMTINEVLLAYIKHAERHYRGPDGNPTREAQHVKLVCRYVRELYGHTPAKGFGPLALKAVRQKFIAAGWCRRSVNQQTERVRRAFRWAAGDELIPFEVYHRLTAVSGLQRGRTEACETDPVKPVDDAIVDATLQHLNRHVRGLVEFQRLTGCRPGEACRLRRCDIDMGGSVWLYRPPQHKGTWRGKSRTIAIGPKAQELLKEFFTPNIGDHLFSPRRAVEEVRAERSKSRKTPPYPSHMKRNESKRKTNPKRTPSERYTRMSYITAIARACDRTFLPPTPLAQQPGETVEAWKARLTTEQKTELKAWSKSHRWQPNQLRHSHGTKVRKEFGLEAAGASLGHSKMSATEVYAERDAQLAVTVAAKIG
jgi:integrase